MKKQKHTAPYASGSKVRSLDTGRGTIRDNHLAALVTSPIFKLQVVNAKKGKGAYLRKGKHKGQEPYLIAV
ncbi:MAG: alternative ribosome-rescue factor [Neptuniibacter sp. Phe_28]|nr:MAG: alternative ribosome-rescue factor [Neptuniibacter sp. Phe_28]